MATTEMNCLATGSVQAEFLDVEASGTTYTCTWGYNAEVVIISLNNSGTTMMFMYDLATKDAYYCSSSTAWTHYGVDSRVTTTPTSFSFDFGASFTNISVVPITNKPNGYFT